MTLPPFGPNDAFLPKTCSRRHQTILRGDVAHLPAGTTAKACGECGQLIVALLPPVPVPVPGQGRAFPIFLALLIACALWALGLAAGRLLGVW
jgi:hypothetical protein